MTSKIVQMFECLGVSPHLTDYGIDSSARDLILKSVFTPGRADKNAIEINQAVRPILPS